MPRTIFALAAAAALAIAAPATADPFIFSMPNLTFPPSTDADVGQSCVDMTVLSEESCPTTN